MKQNLMKRILGLVLSFGLVLGCATPMTAAEVQNEDQQVQVEADEKLAANISLNDLKKTAVELTLNKEKSGVLEKANETDYFKFTIKENGYFNVKFGIGSTTNPSDINNGWDIEIYKESDLTNPIKSVTGVTVAYEFAKLAMEEGTYYVKVSSNSIYYAPTGCEYTVNAAFTASNVWEIEGNDTQSTANTISANTTYSGNLYHEEDMDWYKVTVKDTGVIQLSFNLGKDVLADNIQNGWNVVVYNSNYEAIKTYTGITKDFTAQKLPFSEGTYYIKVYAYNKYLAPVDCTYKLKLATTKSSYWESEYNDLKADADTIKVDKAYSGLLYNQDDTDWYKVKTTKTGYFKIQFTLDESVNKDDILNGWNITLYDKNLDEIITYSGITASQTSGVIPYAAGTYYIKVTANSRYYAPVDCIYKLKVVEKESSVWESEGNDTRKKADSISLNKTYKGLLLNQNDQDWFKFTTKAAGAVKITLKLADSDAADSVSNGWNVYIYKKSSDTIVKEITGVKNKSSVTVDLKKGTYYIKVCANNVYYAPTQCTYGLTVNYSKTPDKVTIKSVTAGTKKVTLKWTKSENADGYIIYRSTSKNGTYKKVATIKKGSTVKYTDKNLKSNTKYYYKVVAYKKTNGVTAYSADSKIKSVKAK